MAELDELKSLDELFESRKALQDKGPVAITALQCVVNEEKLSSEFYPALNAFMIEFVERFALSKKLSEIDEKKTDKYFKSIASKTDKSNIIESISIVRNMVLKYKQYLDKKYELHEINELFGFFSNQDVMDIKQSDTDIIKKNIDRIQYLLHREYHYYNSPRIDIHQGYYVIEFDLPNYIGVEKLINMKLKYVTVHGCSRCVYIRLL
jgi:hypothetical protein